MSADVATVVVAVLGAIGTLSSPVLTQWVASRSSGRISSSRRGAARKTVMRTVGDLCGKSGGESTLS